jgi:hypothetical protein
LDNTTLNENVRTYSPEIKNTHTTVPQSELPIVVNAALQNSDMNQDAFVKDIHSLIQLILEQNYFQYNNGFFTQTNGLAMGTPISGLLAEILIQYIEHNRIVKLASI